MLQTTEYSKNSRTYFCAAPIRSASKGAKNTDTAHDMVMRHWDTSSEIVKFLVDGGYTGENFAQGVTGILRGKINRAPLVALINEIPSLE